MKKILTSSIALASVCMAMVSCEKSPAQEQSNNTPSGNQIVFNLASQDTKAKTDEVSEVTTENLGSIYVAAASGTAGSADAYVADFTQAEFKASSDQTGVSGKRYVGDPAKYWPSTDLGWHFYASNKTFTTTANSAATIDVDYSSAKTKDDIVCSYCNATYKTENKLHLEHIFARICDVTIKLPTGGTQNATDITVKLKPIYSGTYNFYEGFGKTDRTGWTPGAEAVDSLNLIDFNTLDLTSPNNSKTTTNDFFIVPGTYKISVVYTMNKGDYHKQLSKNASSVSIVRGKKNKITATLVEGEVEEIKFDVDVEPWSDNAIDLDTQWDK